MRRPMLWGATLLALAVLVTAPVAGARTSAPAHAGWAVDRVRFEPVDGAGPLSVPGVGSYRGAIEVARGGTGLGVVNDVSLEDYVRGISEVPSSWPIEAQKAQAIAARTYALWERSRSVATEHQALGADICATQACQVYTGLTKERADEAGLWRAAVEATAGEVILYEGAPIVAKYSSSNGGRSVPGGRPYLRAVDDPDDAASRLHRWTSTLPLDQLSVVLGLPVVADDVFRAGELIVARYAEETGEVRDALFSRPQFRELVNNAFPAPPDLPSAMPSVRYDLATDAAANSVAVHGRGWGHGIGMSQWGAFGKARRGMTAHDILAAYYAGLRPVRLAPPQLPERLKVAVATGRSSVRITGGPFRVVDATGSPLAYLTAGVWTVTPGIGGKLQVSAPAAQAGVPVVDQAAIDPAAAAPGSPLSVSFRTSLPSLVSVTATPPGAPPVTYPVQFVNAGSIRLRLPPPSVPGTYDVMVVADAGGGRVGKWPIQFPVTSHAGQFLPEAGARSAVEVSAAREDQGASPVPFGIAGTLLAGVVVGGIKGGAWRRLPAWVRQRPRG